MSIVASSLAHVVRRALRATKIARHVVGQAHQGIGRPQTTKRAIAEPRSKLGQDRLLHLDVETDPVAVHRAAARHGDHLDQWV